MRPGRVELVVQLEWSELATYSRRPSIDSWSIWGPPVSRVPVGWVASSPGRGRARLTCQMVEERAAPT